MQQIRQKGNSKTVYELKINPAEYTRNERIAPISAFRRVISYKDDTEPVQMDSARIAPLFHGIRSRDFKYYFYIISRLVRNDLAIKCPHKEMRDELGDPSCDTVAQGIVRLVQAGLIFPAPHRRGEYLVNPAYAWKGNRLDYLDLSSFEDHT